VRIGQNLIAYATGRELKDKLDSALVINADSLPPPNRHSIPLAMLALDAGGEEASRALPNAAALIAAKTELPLSAPPQPIGFDAEELAGVPVLWIHGRTRFEFTESQVDVLRQYIETGGVIFGSAVCGAKEFAESFRRELKKVLPDAALAAVGSDHPIMTASDGFDIRSVRIRTPAAGKPIAVRQGPAVLELATADNLTAVVFSPLDVSCALESPNSVQCPGYSTETAAKIVANVVLHSLQQ